MLFRFFPLPLLTLAAAATALSLYAYSDQDSLSNPSFCCALAVFPVDSSVGLGSNPSLHCGAGIAPDDHRLQLGRCASPFMLPYDPKLTYRTQCVVIVRSCLNPSLCTPLEASALRSSSPTATSSSRSISNEMGTQPSFASRAKLSTFAVFYEAPACVYPERTVGPRTSHPTMLMFRVGRVELRRSPLTARLSRFLRCSIRQTGIGTRRGNVQRLPDRRFANTVRNRLSSTRQRGECSCER